MVHSFTTNTLFKDAIEEKRDMKKIKIKNTYQKSVSPSLSYCLLEQSSIRSAPAVNIQHPHTKTEYVNLGLAWKSGQYCLDKVESKGLKKSSIVTKT